LPTTDRRMNAEALGGLGPDERGGSLSLGRLSGPPRQQVGRQRDFAERAAAGIGTASFGHFCAI